MTAETVRSVHRASPRQRILDATLTLGEYFVGPRMRKPVDTSRVQRILVLQLQQLGDSVVFTPVLRALRRRFPTARIDLLCSPVSAQLYRKCRLIDGIITGPAAQGAAKLRAWVQLLFGLRRTRYDLAITDVTQVSAVYSLIAFLSSARSRIGFNVDHRGFLHTVQLRRPDCVDFVECNLLIAKSLGAPVSSSEVECYFDQSDESYARDLLRSWSPRPIVAIHAASNWQSKTWVPERWAAIAKALVTEFGATVVFIGAAREHDYVGRIVHMTNAPTLNMVGKTSLSQLAAVLWHADLFIGTDSGPRHVAAGVGCPSVVLMSSQDRPERWTFRRPREVILRTDPPCSPCFQEHCSHRRCMVDISEIMVLDACRGLLPESAPVSAESRKARRAIWGAH